MTPIPLRVGRVFRRRPLVTVVIPAYNVQEYLRDCLESLVTQRVFDRMQVVVVDDGSDDSTHDAALAFANHYPGVVVLHQKNHGPGPGAARNTGLELAKAEYVLFLDGDDYIEPGGLDLLLAALDSTGDDVAIGGMRAFPEAKSYPWDGIFSARNGCSSEGIESVPSLIHNSAPGNKLMRTSALRRRGLTFATGIHHQDTYVTLPLMLLSQRITVVPALVQHYRRRPGSIMDTHFTRRQNFFDHLQVVEHLSHLRPQLPPERHGVLDAFLVRSMQGFVLRAPTLLDPRAGREFFERAGSVYRHVSSSALTASTRTLQHRLAYFAVIKGDWGAYTALSADPVRSVWAHDGALYAGDPQPHPDPLCRVGAVIANVDNLSFAGDDLVIAGTVRVKGAAPVHELPLTVSLRLKGSGVTGRAVTEPTPEGASTRWRVTIPALRVPSGAYNLRLVLQTVTGQVSTATRAKATGDVTAVNSFASRVDLRATAEALQTLQMTHAPATSVSSEANHKREGQL